ncbi:MAG: hypothetical protein M3485_06995 [Pseudomonadota bacterium]|nr:hypothetical protein [Pseudomonadota bacterium]
MTIERSDKLYEASMAAQQKFDYFALGIVGALCAFVGESFEPTRLGYNPSTLEFVSLLMLVGSAVAGFLRIQGTNQLMRMNSHYLRMQEEKGALASALGSPIINRGTGEAFSADQVAAKVSALEEVVPTAREAMDTVGKATLRTYNARNWLLLVGFLLLLLSRVWAAYI